MPTGSLLASCDILYVDHIAVTTSVFQQTLHEYLSLPGARLLRGPAPNPVQKVIYAFVQLGEGTTVEILGPMKDSPIAHYVQQGGGPYHFCFAVRNIEYAVSHAGSAGAKVVVHPIADVAFDGRRVAFLVHPSLGIFEFVEACPVEHGQDAPLVPRKEHGVNPAKTGERATALPRSESDNRAIQNRLKHVFRTVFPQLDDASVIHASFNQTTEWDSLLHLQLIMELETEFRTSIPTDEIGNLTSFRAILEMLEQRLS
jgi:acyl carrier protein